MWPRLGVGSDVVVRVVGVGYAREEQRNDAAQAAHLAVAETRKLMTYIQRRFL